MTMTHGVSDPPSAMVEAVAERLLDKKVWLSCLVDEVGERMINGPLRKRLSNLLVTMLYQRAQVHGEALAILHPVLAELKEEWRTQQGGQNGGPTDTDVLLRTVDRVAKLVNDSEDAVQKTIKLALEEQKASHQYADSVGPTLYQGTGEKLDMPSGLPSGERETIRNLLSLIGKAANEAGTVEGSVSVPVATGVGGGGSSAMAQELIGDAKTLIGDEVGALGGSSAMAKPLEQGSSPPPMGAASSEPSSGAVTDPIPVRARARKKAAKPRADPEAPAPGSTDGRSPSTAPKARHRKSGSTPRGRNA